jgi:hypothetical protein
MNYIRLKKEEKKKTKKNLTDNCSYLQ